MEGTIRRRFCAWPVPKTPEGESALQACKLEDKYILWSEQYTIGNNSIGMKYFYHVNCVREEHLILEIEIRASHELKLSSADLETIARKIYEAGKTIEKEKQILPMFIRKDKNEEYILHQQAKSVYDWLQSLMEKPETAPAH